MSEREAIGEAIQAFVASYNAGDLEALVAYYDDDLVKVRHGAEPEPKQDAARRIQGAFARFHTRVEVTNAEIEVSGDLASTRGTFVVTLSPRDGGDSQHVSRRYLEVWRKRAGQWRVARTMDNV